MTSKLDLWLLGPWKAELDGIPLPPLPTRHARALLARLALAHPHLLTRTQLYAELFMEGDARLAPHKVPASVAQHFRTTLFYLRRVLGGHVVVADEQIGLEPALCIGHDVGQFQVVAQKEDLADLQIAVHLYRGPFLGTGNDGWAAHIAQQLHHCYVDMLRRLVLLAQAQGTLATYSEIAKKWVTEEPWDEHAHVALLTALVQRGDHAAATTQLQHARALFQAELGRPPSADFEVMARAITRMPASPTRAVARPRSVPTPTLDFAELPLIGREDALRQLLAAWGQARQGVAQIEVIEGVAGVGKTRLAQTFAAQTRLASQALVLWGVADDTTADRALGLLRNAFERLPTTFYARVNHACQQLKDVAWSVLRHDLPELARIVPERPAPQPVQLEGVAQQLRRKIALLELCDALSQAGPLLLVLENSRLADDETSELVQAITGTSCQMLVLLTRRPDPQQEAGNLPILSLAPLADHAAQTLLQAALGDVLDATLVDRLHTTSAGNPLFIREILRVLWAQGSLKWGTTQGWHLAGEALTLPDPVTDLLARRLESLPPAALQLAQILAVLGRPADEGLLVSLSPDEESRLPAQAALLERWVLVERGAALHWDHAWLREALLLTLDERSRCAIHRQIAAALQNDERADLGERMQHHAGGHEWEAAFVAALKVAEQALDTGRVKMATDALAVADHALVALQTPPHDPRRWSLLLHHESRLTLTGRGPAWKEIMATMEQIAHANNQVEWHVEVLIRRGRALRELGQPEAAERALRDAVHLAHGVALTTVEANARSMLAAVLDDRGAVAEALGESATAVQVSAAVTDEVLQLRILAIHAYMCMRAGQIDQAIVILEPMRADPNLDQHPVPLARITRQLAIVYMAARRYEDGFTLLRESVRRNQAIGDLHGVLIAQTSLFYELTNFGVYDEGRPLGEATLELARRLGARMQEGALLNLLAGTYFHTGDARGALPLAEESVVIADALGLPEYTAASLDLLASIALSLGWINDAQRHIVRAEALLAVIDHPTVNVAATAAVVWLAAGQPIRARQAAQAAIKDVVDTGLSASSSVQALWLAADVLLQTDGPVAAQPVQQQAYDRLLDDLLRLKSAHMRRALLDVNAAHRAVALFHSRGPRRLVRLPQSDAPTGRPLHADDLMPVVWTLRATDDPDHPVALRHRQLQRLTTEAVAQGALATVEALADVLAVSSRTVLRDIQALQAQDVTITTRASIQKR